MPAVGIEPVQGQQEGVVANVGAEALDITLTGQSMECHRD